MRRRSEAQPLHKGESPQVSFLRGFPQYAHHESPGEVHGYEAAVLVDATRGASL